MVYRFTEQHNEIVQKILQQIQAKMPEDQYQLIEKLVRAYYAAVADEDLGQRNVMDLYGAVLSHWNFLLVRKKDEVKVRVFNPKYEQHGWQSNHTVIEISMPDMPFIVDSLRMCLTKKNFTIHLMIHPGGICFKRDATGKVIDLLSLEGRKQNKGAQMHREALIYIEIDQQLEESVLESIHYDIEQVLADVTVMVQDWQNMQAAALQMHQELQASPPPMDKEELSESLDFIRWIAEDNFTFLGCRDYALVGEPGSEVLRVIPDTGLGLLRDDRIQHAERRLGEMPPKARAEALSSNKILLMQQLSGSSTVHRPSAPYYIGIKRISPEGKVIGERRFIGLYTSVAYHSSPQQIPLLRRKVQKILQESLLPEGDHSWKNLLNILETYPRDELIQANEDELYRTAMGIFHLQERRRIRLFLRKDPYGRFYSCLVFVPRDQFNSELREKIGKILCSELNCQDIDFKTHFSESILARIHFIIRADDDIEDFTVNIHSIEKKVAAAARTWDNDLADALRDYYGEARASKLIQKYDHAFPASYREIYPARTAVYDIEHMDGLSAEAPISMTLYRPLESIEGNLHFKLYCYDKLIPLSDILPMLENMGLRVIGERSQDIQPTDGNNTVWISDFSMLHAFGQSINVDKVRTFFQDAFARIWLGEAESDGFNSLVLSADLNWRQTAVLRAYAKYMRQIGFTFSQNYIEETLCKYPAIVRKLAAFFALRFDPKQCRQEVDFAAEKAAIIAELENVSSLDEDKIIRRYVDLIAATLRTNFYQHDKKGNEKTYISLKVDPRAVPEMPLPRPLLEFFVYSPSVEGVHLRSAKVARGGLRWSDRREDFRTEVLGLMKAQQVKNAVIVPAGAKGGFVCKNLPAQGSRDEIMNEVIKSYKTFIRGILDLTDNLSGTQVVHPQDTVRYDEDDYYLVVAADKGTATFSDIANSLSLEYGFWLGDAFASGGSTGYDHKGMGITARGAWESVKRHFLELGTDVQSQDFSVIGIGDMGGDVFGNGMLLSKHIKLVAAFNHMHIFLDPEPDTAISFEERKRLFELPRSTWADYNQKLISAGGGIYSRTAKAIKLSAEVRALLGVEQESMPPNDLLRAILKAPVDLLWNGGIGTYVKGSQERDADVGDRANNALRINGVELRCKVVGEGGNLGLTQLGRVEFGLNGGISFTDFIDNAGGVDCSDHEVNIKILLNTIFEQGDLTEKQRNHLLADMTEEVAELVLANNYKQTIAIGIASYRSNSTLDEYRRFIHALERGGRLDRELEFLPDDEELADRKANNAGLTRPELAVLLAYSKILLKEELLTSDVPEDPYLAKILATAFPLRLSEQFTEAMSNHRMRREIIATQMSNIIANEMGATFIKRLFDETGAPAPMVARSYMVAREIFDMDGLSNHICALDKKVDSNILMLMNVEVMRLLRRATRWFLRNRRLGLEVGETITHFKPKVRELTENLEEYLVGLELENMQKVAEEFIDAGVPKILANAVAGTSAMISALDIIEASSVNNIPVNKVAETYFALGASLQLDWFREEIGHHRVANNWDALARAACKDDLDRQQRSITEGVLAYKSDDNDVNQSMEIWMEDHQILVERWFYMVSDLKSTKSREFSMFAVALRELLDLAQASSRKYAVS